MDDKLLTTKQVAERLTISEVTLRQWRMQDVGPKYIRLGHGKMPPIRYRLSDLVDFEKKGES